jgi:hypothetical protein
MFDYNGFAANGNIGGFQISVGTPSYNPGYPSYPGPVVTTQPYPPTYPVGAGWGIPTDSGDKTMWLLLGVIALFVMASK